MPKKSILAILYHICQLPLCSQLLEDFLVRRVRQVHTLFIILRRNPTSAIILHLSHLVQQSIGYQCRKPIRIRPQVLGYPSHTYTHAHEQSNQPTTDRIIRVRGVATRCHFKRLIGTQGGRYLFWCRRVDSQAMPARNMTAHTFRVPLSDEAVRRTRRLAPLINL